MFIWEGYSANTFFLERRVIDMEQFAEFAYLYDELNVNYDKEKIANRIRQLICPCREAVDLCCGTGDVAILLSKCGIKVIGIDISKDMLNVATEKAMNNAARVLFVCADAKNFQVPAKVDAVYSLADGMNYMLGEDELQKAFCSVNKALKCGGLFVFDLSTQSKYENLLDGKTFTFDFDDAFAVWQNDYNKKTHICQMDVTCFIKKGKNAYKRFDETHFQYCFSMETIKQMLENTGFELKSIYSGYDDKPFDENDERALIVAVKK